MSNENAIHELYEQCMTINFDETHIFVSGNLFSREPGN